MHKLFLVAPLVLVLTGAVAPSLAQPAKDTNPAAAERRVDKSSPQLMTGKVTQVDAKAKTFTIMSKGKEYRFTFQKIEALPKVGAVVDVTYSGTPDGPMEAINLNSSKSNVY